VEVATLEINLRTPHVEQLRFLRSRAKRRILRAGRRSGKTTALAIAAVEAFLYDQRRILYAVPTQEQVDRFWFEVKAAVDPLILEGIAEKNEVRHTIELPGTEQRIRAKTAWNADTLRGDYADLLVLDEFQLMDEDAWQLVGAPMLLDNDGDAVFSYTPPSALTRSVTKARDPRHAAKLYAKHKDDPSGRWETFHFTSHANPHLSSKALEEITLDMDDLAYRQEILAEDVETTPGALWTPQLIDEARVSTHPALSIVTVNLDPATTAKAGSDETGITTTARGKDGLGYLLNDLSGKYLPEQWGQIAVAEYHARDAAYIVAESNQGGEMVRSVLKGIDPHVPVKLIPAKSNKYARAVPVLSRWQRGEIKIVGKWPELENQMCNWVDGMRMSPDRLDSMVHGFTELMLGKRAKVIVV